MESTTTPTSTKLKTVLVVSLLLNATMAVLVLSNLQRSETPKAQYGAIASQNQNLTRTVNLLRQELGILQDQLSYYKAQADYYSRLSRSNGTVGTGITGRSEINIVAVREVRKSISESTYEGVVMTADVELRVGSGRLLINTRPKIGIDLQTSANTAILVAENLTKLSLKNTDVILTVIASTENEILDGPSAGAAITIALIAAMKDQTPSTTVFMTGTINPDKSIGKVSGVLEKALVAARFGAKKFLVPLGQSLAVTYKMVESHPAPGFTIITTKPETINIQEYVRGQGFNIEVLEVSNVTQAYDLFVSK